MIGKATPPCGLRERKKARTREAIIDAAIDLFERQGYEATTVEEIAAAADVSERTFFRYFESKLEVVLASKDAEVDDFESLMLARPEDEGPFEAFRQVLLETLVPRVAEHDLSRRQFQLVMRTPSLRAFAHEHFNAHQQELARAFAHRLAVPPYSLAPQVMATSAAAATWTVMDRWVEEGASPKRLGPLLEEALDLLANGLR